VEIARSADPGPDLLDSGLELLAVGHEEGQLRGVGLHRLEPDRVAHPLREPWLPHEVDGVERRHLGDDRALLEPAPVLVLALDHGLQARAVQPVALREQGHQRADREVPEADDRVHRVLPGVQLRHGAIEQIGDRDLAVLHLFGGQQRDEGLLLVAGHGAQHGEVLVIGPENGDRLRVVGRLHHARAVPTRGERKRGPG
jgi:hypothetical protein